MNKIIFSSLEIAERVAEKREKSVYKLLNKKYFVGTYDQAIKRI